MELTDLISQVHNPKIIMGDFNGHNFMWRCEEQDTRGSTIEQVMTDLNLNILNDGSKTRFNTYNGTSSAIDLTLCNPSLHQHLTWEVLPFSYDSDHSPVLVVDKRRSADDSTPIQKWKLHEADWEQYTILTDALLIKFSIREDINETINNFNDILITAADITIGLTKNMIHRTDVPWWNKECKEALKESKHAFHIYKKHNTIDNQLRFKALRAKTRYIFRKSKKDSWMKYVQNISSSTSLTSVWKKVNTISGNKSYNKITGIKQDEILIIKSKDIAEALEEAFQKNSSDAKLKEDFLKNRVSIE